MLNSIKGGRSLFISSLLLSFFLLQACTDVAMTGAQVVYNRRSLQKNFNDHYLTREIYQALYNNTDDFRDSHIAIATYNREVLLAGQVLHPWQKTKAEEITKEIQGIDHIYNLIAVTTPSSTLTRMSDAFITTKIKAKLLASDDLDSSQIKVVTENGIVYLMGTLPVADAEVATDIASSTDGVQSVVKIFSYMTISKDKNINL